MKTVLALATVMCLAAGSAILAEDKPVVKEGDKAPDFKLKGTDDKEYTLKQFAGKQAVVLAWYPKADTPGCTKECISMKEYGDELRKYEVAYFTASVDSVEENKKFVKKYELDYPILSDPDKTLARALGVLIEERGMANRWTFIIDKDGVIRYIDKNVNPRVQFHGLDVAKKLEELGVPKKK
ncbi:MAG: peroxiredoxin family protein [Planctomycetaceae bacterium]